MLRNSGDSGFTLVELMVVVLILGILVAIAIPVFNSSRSQAQKRACQANQRTYEGAYQVWYMEDKANELIADTLDTKAKLDAKLIPRFIKEPPRCVRGGTYTLVQQASALSVDLVCSFNSGTDLDQHNQ